MTEAQASCDSDRDDRIPVFSLTCVEDGDTAALSALGDLWYRAHDVNGSLAPATRSEACALVSACAEDSLWRLAGRFEEQLIAMAIGVQVRENDGAGAPIVGEVLLRCVAVDPSYRNRGFGRKTVGGLLHLACERGFSAAQLWVARSNRPARKLYERLGFRESGREMMDDRGERMSHWNVSLNAPESA